MDRSSVACTRSDPNPRSVSPATGRQGAQTVTTENDPSNLEDREIVLTREFDASRELVWEAWTQPEHLARWWGPDGCTTTIHEMDVRPGGTLRFDMHVPNVRDFPNYVVYTEVVRPERLVYDHSGDERGPASLPGDGHVRRSRRRTALDSPCVCFSQRRKRAMRPLPSAPSSLATRRSGTWPSSSRRGFEPDNDHGESIRLGARVTIPRESRIHACNLSN